GCRCTQSVLSQTDSTSIRVYLAGRKRKGYNQRSFAHGGVALWPYPAHWRPAEMVICIAGRLLLTRLCRFDSNTKSGLLGGFSAGNIGLVRADRCTLSKADGPIESGWCSGCTRYRGSILRYVPGSVARRSGEAFRVVTNSHHAGY